MKDLKDLCYNMNLPLLWTMCKRQSVQTINVITAISHIVLIVRAMRPSVRTYTSWLFRGGWKMTPGDHCQNGTSTICTAADSTDMLLLMRLLLPMVVLLVPHYSRHTHS
jgi:hypothetical protein